MLQPVDAVLAFKGIGFAVNVLQFNGLVVAITGVDFVQCLDFLEHRHKLFALVDGLGKGNGAAHRLRVVGKIVILTGEMGLFCKTIHATYNFDGIIKRQFVIGIRQLLLQGTADKIFINGQNDNLIIGKQALRDSIREAKAVELRAVDGFIVHRAKKGAVVLGFLLTAIRINTRGCSHV